MSNVYKINPPTSPLGLYKNGHDAVSHLVHLQSTWSASVRHQGHAARHPMITPLMYFSVNKVFESLHGADRHLHTLPYGVSVEFISDDHARVRFHAEHEQVQIRSWKPSQPDRRGTTFLRIDIMNPRLLDEPLPEQTASRLEVVEAVKNHVLNSKGLIMDGVIPLLLLEHFKPDATFYLHQEVVQSNFRTLPFQFVSPDGTVERFAYSHGVLMDNIRKLKGS